MNKLRFLKRYFFYEYFMLLVCASMLYSCKVYQDPISLNEAANNTSSNVFKVTMLNGDEYIYDNIEVNNNNYFGINKKPNEIVETPLIKNEIKSIQEKNRKSSSLSNLIGVGVGIGSVVLAILMMQ
ncbi:hypothetical protein [Lutibacter flavus]|uniref:Lipoprotein n=1 Tax=Lutibacter flavus TaxID=691689 RepID=A0A238YPT5_9FLAO|nr:hypothetical protein [Lutibacter flavus]SNR72603.1 hypothetical protein SAMN04488111_2679 [Lutibacter flavus]